jgi:hypothetical protein
VAAKEVAVKKHVVRLSADERAQLNDIIHKGKRSAQLVTKARILLKADISEAGDPTDCRFRAACATGRRSPIQALVKGAKRRSRAKALRTAPPPPRRGRTDDGIRYLPP